MQHKTALLWDTLHICMSWIWKLFCAIYCVALWKLTSSFRLRNNIKKKTFLKNHHVVQFAKRRSDIIKAKNNKILPTEETTKSSREILTQSIDEDLLSDMERFRNREKELKEEQLRRIQATFGKTSNQNIPEENSAMTTFKNAFSVILIADFFLVLFFLGWFLVAVVLQGTYPALLLKFQEIFQPVIVPSLSVLMAGSIASGAIEYFEKKGKEK